MLPKIDIPDKKASDNKEDKKDPKNQRKNQRHHRG